MTSILEKLHSMVYNNLLLNSPVLSGNMQSLIQIGQVNDKSAQIIIDAPFYDMNKWKQDKVIVHTHKVINGKSAYAETVNRSGAFGKHNKSEKWANRAIYDACNIIANEIGAVVINELEL